ncbi:LuxR family two component transcriptional regulator [Kribbella sp. VKM Ac-2527]|uniref:LuxR family two component transcriptional regulator n=1 Tax=Kribbella caucasensis TaxID=2512215 RepID=A0A4R6KEC6_9ACTN|nr:LuxR family two component transcriptional regulator [Kribbella sp. VKM Ac-2527]
MGSGCTPRYRGRHEQSGRRERGESHERSGRHERRGVVSEESGAESIRVLVVDDDALVRASLEMMLDGANGISVVGQAADGDEVPAAVDAHFPDLVLMDLRMPRVDGIVATRRLRARKNPPDVVVLTTFDTDENVLHALRAGASGFLLKDTPPAQIVEAVRRVAAGDPILSPAITRRLMDRAATQADAHTHAQSALSRLSPREYDVMLAVAQGKANAEIAAELFMSVATVKAHISHILTKLGLGNRTQIALLAHDAGLA